MKQCNRWAFGLALLVGLWGCGGKMSLGSVVSGDTGGSTGPGQLVSNYTASFHVDVKSGKVTITRANTSPKLAGTVYGGNMVGFTSSLLVDQPGDTGVKVLDVSLTNNAGVPIGVSQSGVSVLFGAISATTSLTNIEDLISVSTRAGTTAGYTNGTLASAQFRNPTAIAYNPVDGSLWVADFANNVIRRIGSSGVTTVAGSTAGEVDGAGTAAKFYGPYGIAYNPSDSSFVVTDLSGNKVRRVTQAGIVTTVAGTGAAGETMGAGNQATIKGPTGVAVTPAGTIYISANDNIIRQINLTGTSPTSAANFTVSLLAGSSAGTAGYADGVGASASFSAPKGLALDPSGSLYVADYTNDRVRLISSGGQVVTIAGTGSAGDVNGAGNTAEFENCLGLAYANGILAVTDSSTDYVRFMWLAPGASPNSSLNWNVANAAGTGSPGSANGDGEFASFSLPYFMCADISGNFYVADYSNSLIREVAPTTGTFNIGTFGGTFGTSPVTLANPTGIIPDSTLGAQMPYIEYPGGVGNGSSTASQQWEFAVPSGVTAFDFQVTVEADSAILTQPGAALNEGSTSVDVRTFAGALGASSGYINGNLDSARFSATGYQLAMDQNGNIYDIDEGNNAVRILTGGQVGTVAGTIQNASDPSGTFDTGNGAQAQFNRPSGVAVSPNGSYIYVVDGGNAVVDCIAAATPGSTDPTTYQVSVISNGTESYSNGTVVTTTYTGMNQIAMAPGGDLYVAVNNESVPISLIEHLNYVGGNPGTLSSWWTTIFVQGGKLSDPQGLTFDLAGNLYVANGTGNNIVMITPDGTQSVLAGNGTSGYADGNGSSAEFDNPTGICCDPAGYLYVSDTGNEVIRRIAIANGYTETVAGLAKNPGDKDTDGFAAQLNDPLGICMSPSGTIYFYDGAAQSTKSNSIRMIQAVQTHNSTAGKRK